MFLVCYLIPFDYVMKWSCDFRGGNPSWQFPTLPSLVVAGIVVVEIKFFQWLMREIPYVRLNPSLLLLFKAHGIKAHDMSC